MTYAFKDYWTEVTPVRGADHKKVLYWRYKIFAFGEDGMLFDGYDADCPSALATAQAHIENLSREVRMSKLKVA